MKTFNQQPEGFVLLVLKVSIFYLLCLFAMNCRYTKAQPVQPIAEINSTKSLQSKVRQIYTSQIGVREKGNNSGPEVEQYLRYVNLSKGNPWCAAFVCWVYGKAGVANPRTGWSPGLFEEGRVIWGSGEPRAKNQEPRFPQNANPDPRIRNQEPRFPQSALSYTRRLTTNNEQSTTPSPGDIFGLYFPEKSRIAHVGFIDSWDGTWMISVEGNTNPAGSREGDGVYRKRRLVRTVYKVARYIN